MATFAELKELSEHMDRLNRSVRMDYDAVRKSRLNTHISKVNDDFCKANKGAPGVLDYDERGFTEPEDERDCYANNKTLARLDEAMPYLEEMNVFLTDDKINSPNYSMHSLHLVDTVLTAKDEGLDDEAKLSYMCEIAAKKDYDYFGCKWDEYDTSKVMGYFDEDMSLDDVKDLLSMNSECYQSVEFYRDFCSKTGMPENREAIHVIGGASDMGIAYGLENAITYGNMSIEDAKVMSRCMDKIIEASKDKDLNPKYEAHYTDEEGKIQSYETHRLSSYGIDAYIQDYTDSLQDAHGFRHHPKAMEALFDEFIHTKDVDEKGEPYTCVSNYYNHHKEHFDKLIADEKVPVKDADCIKGDYLRSKQKNFVGMNRISGGEWEIALSDKKADELGIYHDKDNRGMIGFSLDVDTHEVMISARLEKPGADSGFFSIYDDADRFSKEQKEAIMKTVADTMRENYPSFRMYNEPSIPSAKSVQISEEKSSDKSAERSAMAGNTLGVNRVGSSIENNGPKF